MRLLMSCQTPSTPSCHATTLVTLHGDTPPLDNVRHSITRVMTSMNCGTPSWRYGWEWNRSSLARLCFLLSMCAIFILPLLEGSRPSCTAGKVLRTFSDTHTPSRLGSSFFTHTYTVSPSRALMLTCSSEAVSFHKVPAGFALPGTVDAVSHVNLELETDVELGLRLPYRLLPSGLSVCVSVCVFDQENHFLYFAFRIWVSHRNQRFWSCFYIVSTKCSHVSFVALLVLAVILDTKLG